ncbi:hypothetical protein STRIP9103_01063, partial [Streptomyces ipomoeae 91-03]
MSPSGVCSREGAAP